MGRRKAKRNAQTRRKNNENREKSPTEIRVSNVDGTALISSPPSPYAPSGSKLVQTIKRGVDVVMGHFIQKKGVSDNFFETDHESPTSLYRTASALSPTTREMSESFLSSKSKSARKRQRRKIRRLLDNDSSDGVYITCRKAPFRNLDLYSCSPYITPDINGELDSSMAKPVFSGLPHIIHELANDNLTDEHRSECMRLLNDMIESQVKYMDRTGFRRDIVDAGIIDALQKFDRSDYHIWPLLKKQVDRFIETATNDNIQGPADCTRGVVDLLWVLLCEHKDQYEEIFGFLQTLVQIDGKTKMFWKAASNLIGTVNTDVGINELSKARLSRKDSFSQIEVQLNELPAMNNQLNATNICVLPDPDEHVQILTGIDSSDLGQTIAKSEPRLQTENSPLPQSKYRVRSVSPERDHKIVMTSCEPDVLKDDDNKENIPDTVCSMLDSLLVKKESLPMKSDNGSVKKRKTSRAMQRREQMSSNLADDPNQKLEREHIPRIPDQPTIASLARSVGGSSKTDSYSSRRQSTKTTNSASLKSGKSSQNISNSAESPIIACAPSISSCAPSPPPIIETLLRKPSEIIASVTEHNEAFIDLDSSVVDMNQSILKMEECVPSVLSASNFDTDDVKTSIPPPPPLPHNLLLLSNTLSTQAITPNSSGLLSPVGLLGSEAVSPATVELTTSVPGPTPSSNLIKNISPAPPLPADDGVNPTMNISVGPSAPPPPPPPPPPTHLFSRGGGSCPPPAPPPPPAHLFGGPGGPPAPPPPPAHLFGGPVGPPAPPPPPSNLFGGSGGPPAPPPPPAHLFGGSGGPPAPPPPPSHLFSGSGGPPIPPPPPAHLFGGPGGPPAPPPPTNLYSGPGGPPPPPPPMNLFSGPGGLPPPPPHLLKGSHSLYSSRIAPPICQESYPKSRKTAVLRWDSVNQHAVSAGPTVWSLYSKPESNKEEREEIEKALEQVVATPRILRAPKAEKKKEPTGPRLGQSRAMALEICLAKARPRTVLDLIHLIESNETDKISNDLMTGLSNAYPVQEETSMFKNVERSVVTRQCEELCWEVARRPTLKSRLELAIAKGNIIGEIDAHKTSVESLLKACVSMRHEVINKMLYKSLQYGNFINQGSNIPYAAGFKIKSLQDILTLKGKGENSSWTLVDHLARYLDISADDVEETKSNLQLFRSYKISEVSSAVDELNRTVSKLKRMMLGCEDEELEKYYEPFFNTVEENVQKLLNDIEKLLSLEDELRTYFCANKADSVEELGLVLFNALNLFVNSKRKVLATKQQSAINKDSKTPTLLRGTPKRRGDSDDNRRLSSVELCNLFMKAQE